MAIEYMLTEDYCSIINRGLEDDDPTKLAACEAKIFGGGLNKTEQRAICRSIDDVVLDWPDFSA